MQRQLDNAQKAEAAAWPPHHGVQQGKVPGGGMGDAADHLPGHSRQRAQRVRRNGDQGADADPGGAAAAAAVQPGALAHRCTRCVLAKTAVFWFFWVFFIFFWGVRVFLWETDVW